jgi:hypothetical protein
MGDSRTVDVADLDREAALDTLAWTASTLVRAVLDQSDGRTTSKNPRLGRIRDRASASPIDTPAS